MPNYYNDFISGNKEDNPNNEVIIKIVNYIKYKNNYKNAVKLILENNLKIEEIVNTSSRLKKVQIVELANKLILEKDNSN